MWGRMNEYDKTAVDDICKTIIEGVVGDGTSCKLRVLYCREITKDDKSIIEVLSPSLCTLPCNPGLPQYQGLNAFELFSPVSLRELLPYLNAFLQQQVMLKVVCIRLYSQGNDPTDVHKLFGTLGSLFVCPQFQALSIKIDEPIESRSSLLLLRSFMSAPCTHEQQLTYDMGGYMRQGIEISSSEIASLNTKGDSECIAQCTLDHKTLLSRTYDIYHTLLLFLMIRLKDLDLTGKELHTFAQHPDLQISKLRLNLIDETAREDIEVFMKLPTLTELTVYGSWSDVVHSAPAQGLVEQAKIGSLRSISLCTNSFSSRAITCSGSEFQVMWDALFSLPQLSDLELSISGQYMLEAVNRYEYEIYESWRSTAVGRQLKLIKCVYTDSARDNNYEFALLGQICQSCQVVKMP